MAIIPQDVLDDLRTRCDVVDVIGSYLQLRRAGSSYKALCPFHKEKTPSFHVNPQRQSFHCFGCGAGGNVFRFIMDYEGVDFVTAVKMLARRVGLVLQFEESDAGKRTDKERLFKIHEDLAAFYRRMLDDASGAAVRAYLAERDLEEAANTFGFGYAPEAPEALRRWAASRKISNEDLEKAGILVRREQGGWYDRFRNRLMIPIADELGRVIGFSGRVLRKEDSPAKYVNSPETMLFHKSRVLYAIDRARKAIIEQRTAILCEGQIDTVRCHLAGVENVVAAQGTAVTEDHARLIKRYADDVVLVLDADTAGENAALRSAEVFYGGGMGVRVAALPPGEDPDSLIRSRGADAFRRLVDEAVPAAVFQIDVLRAREPAGDAAAVRRIARAALESISRAPGAVQRDQLLHLAADRLQLPVNVLGADLRGLLRRPGRAEPGTPSDAPRPHPFPPEEAGLAELLLAHPEQADTVRHYLPMSHITDEACRRLLEALLAHKGDEPWQLPVDAGDDPVYSRLCARVTMAPRRLDNEDFTAERAVQDYILSIWRRRLMKRREEVRHRMQQAEGAARDQLQIEGVELTQQIDTLGQGWSKALAIIEL